MLNEMNSQNHHLAMFSAFFILILMLVVFFHPASISTALNITKYDETSLQAVSNQDSFGISQVVTSPLHIFRDGGSFIMVNASTEAMFNFTFSETNSSWIRTDVFIEGPLGGLLNGGTIGSDSRRINRIVHFFAGETPGMTWLRVSGFTKDGEKSTQYIPMRILPVNDSRESAFFLVSGMNSDDDSDSFILMLKDSRLINEARVMLQNNESRIITGVIALGWGGFNADLNHDRTWSWHLVPESVNFTELSIESCDATPSYVENNLMSWIHQVGRYCPWSWKIEREISYQDILINVIDGDQQEPTVTATDLTVESDFLEITVTASDDVGIREVSLEFTLNDATTVTIPARPLGNGSFSLNMPSTDLDLLVKASITVLDVANHSTTKIMLFKTRSTNYSQAIPSFSLELMLLVLFVGVIMGNQDHRTRHDREKDLKFRDQGHERKMILLDEDP